MKAAVYESWIRSLEEQIAAFEPRDRPVHCSNCEHARVSGPPEDPQARCDCYSTEPMPLVRLLRAWQPRGFRLAARCPNFVAAGD